MLRQAYLSLGKVIFCVEQLQTLSGLTKYINDYLSLSIVVEEWYENFRYCCLLYNRNDFIIRSSYFS